MRFRELRERLPFFCARKVVALGYCLSCGKLRVLDGGLCQQCRNDLHTVALSKHKAKRKKKRVGGAPAVSESDGMGGCFGGWLQAILGSRADGAASAKKRTSAIGATTLRAGYADSLSTTALHLDRLTLGSLTIDYRSRHIQNWLSISETSFHPTARATARAAREIIRTT